LLSYKGLQLNRALISFSDEHKLQLRVNDNNGYSKIISGASV